ncbi:hypothetical protein EOM86_06465 [Candidatus Nomurabacteria bacterium]|nr:hypothetical protein [Candidatus Nomurabacteria bacterium]
MILIFHRSDIRSGITILRSFRGFLRKNSLSHRQSRSGRFVMTDNKPNILLLFCDQFRWDCISALGNSELITPNLDRLSREGTSFTRAYSPSPVCVPARNSKFWGLYPCNTGVCDNDRTFKPFSENVMEILGEKGYYSHGIGKMHFAVDPTGLNGFSSRERQEEMASDTETDEYLKYLTDKGYNRVFDVHGQRSEMYYIPQISLLPQKDHPTNWVGDRSVKFFLRTPVDTPCGPG